MNTVKEAARLAYSAGWRLILIGTMCGLWMAWREANDHSFGESTYFGFGSLLVLVVTLVLLQDTDTRQRLDKELKTALKDNGRLSEVNARLRVMTPPGGVALVDREPLPEDRPAPTRPHDDLRPCSGDLEGNPMTVEATLAAYGVPTRKSFARLLITPVLAGVAAP